MIKENLSVTSEILSFAEPLKKVASETFKISLEDLEDRKNNHYECTQELSYREVIQNLGEAIKNNIGRYVWIDLLLNKASCVDSEVVIVSDLRFTDEIKAVLSNGHGVLVIEVVGLKNQDDTHISEQGISNKYITHQIINNGTMEDLHKKVLSFLENIGLKKEENKG
jgi:hypothetical protein